MNELIRKTIFGFAQLIIILGVLLFAPAWTLDFWQAWVYLFVFAASAALITMYLWKMDPKLLERRVNAGPGAEKEQSQRLCGWRRPRDRPGPVLPTLNMAWALDRTTRFTASESARPTGLSADAAWTALEQAGATLRDVLRSGASLALGTVTVNHPRFGTMTLYHSFAFIGAHEARHADQIREIVKVIARST